MIIQIAIASSSVSKCTAIRLCEQVVAGVVGQHDITAVCRKKLHMPNSHVVDSSVGYRRTGLPSDKHCRPAHPAAGPTIYQDRLFQACFPIFSTVCMELAATTVLISDSLSVCTSRHETFYSLRLSLNTDPTCRQRL